MGEPAPRPPTAGEIRAHVDGWCGGVMYCAICLRPEKHAKERDTFIRNYCAAFLAHVAGQRYTAGVAAEASDNPPAWDALFCAERAWDAFCEARKCR